MDKQGKWWQAKRADGSTGSAFSLPPSLHVHYSFLLLPQSRHPTICKSSKTETAVYFRGKISIVPYLNLNTTTNDLLTPASLLPPPLNTAMLCLLAIRPLLFCLTFLFYMGNKPETIVQYGIYISLVLYFSAYPCNNT